MLKNASFLAIVAVHTAENEPLKVWKKAEKWALCEAPELTALKNFYSLAQDQFEGPT